MPINEHIVPDKSPTAFFPTALVISIGLLNPDSEATA